MAVGTQHTPPMSEMNPQAIRAAPSSRWWNGAQTAPIVSMADGAKSREILRCGRVPAESMAANCASDKGEENGRSAHAKKVPQESSFKLQLDRIW